MKTYLGFGVYVEEVLLHFDLTVEGLKKGDPPISIRLEPKVAVALVAYINKKMGE